MWSYTVMDTLLLLTSLVFGGITDGDEMTSRATFVVHMTGMAREGQTLTLSCYLSGPPASSIALPSSYIWVKDGKVIPEKTEGTLTLGPLTSKDVGDYECGASELDIPRESHHLEVILSPMVHILPMTPDLVVKGVLGENLTLTCEVTQAFPEVPADGYSWDYVPTLEGPVRHLMENTSTLSLGPLTKEDSGQYVCQARNDHDFKTMTLVGTASVTVDVVYLQEISVTTNRDVNEGDMAVITCSVDSHPTARLTWIVDGNEVGQGTDNIDYYVIPQVACSDGTNYTCRATNPDLPDREETATTRLQVKCVKDGASVLPKPRIYQNEGIAYIGYPLMLHCYTSSPADDGLTYIWFKDSQKVKADPSPFYWFARVKKGDRGVYTCQTSLEKPRALSSTSDPLTVHPRDPPETMVKKKEQQHYDRTKRSTRLPTPAIIHDSLPVCGKRLSLQCLIMGKYNVRDHIVYTWYKDNKVYKENWGQILWFQNISEADKGKYTCTASKGPPETTSHPSFFFDIDPVFYPHLRITQATAEGIVKGKIGENVTLTCEVIKSNPMVPYTGYCWSYLPCPQALKQPLEGNRRTMILGPLTKESKGQYFCQARNDQNFETVTLIGNTSVALEVVYLDSISLTPDLVVNESEPVTLTCRVDSYPVANITWIVNGEILRTVTDNVDHYFIPCAACSDSTNYTCLANNADLPGQEITATTHLDVLCRQYTQNGCLQNDSIEADVAAPFNFTLPKQSQVVVIHPSGQDLVTVYHNCAFAISPSFQTRCQHPHCSRDLQHFSFILTNVTATDAGNYTCKEEGGQEGQKHDCNKTLIVKPREADDSKIDSSTLLVLSVTLNVLLISLSGAAIVKNRHDIVVFLKGFWLGSTPRRTKIQQRENRGKGFDELYDKDYVYIFPPLVQPTQTTQNYNDETGNELSPFLSASGYLQQKSAEYLIKDFVRSALQTKPCKSDLPSFILHNTHLSSTENIILILSRTVGVALMIVKAEQDVFHLQSVGVALQHLLKARDFVRKTLKGLVKSKSIGTVVVLPNMPKDRDPEVRDQVRILKKHPEVDLLCGRDKEIKTWAQQRSRRPDSKVWGLDSPDTAFKMATSEFLTSAGIFLPQRSFSLAPDDKAWLLTPKQMEVRDSTARLLHLWGPVGEGKSTLMMHRAKQWLADGKIVILAVEKETYDVLPSHFIKGTLSKEGEKPQIRVCHTNTALEMAIRELQGFHPGEEICIITNILDRAMFASILKVVQSHSVAAVWSTSAESLHEIDARLADQASQLHWETFKMPSQMKCPKSKMKLLNLLIESSATTPSDPPNQGSPGWRVVDHCLHPNYNSFLNGCSQCMNELSTALSPSAGQKSKWIVLHTGNPHVNTNLDLLTPILEEMNLPALLNLSETRKEEHIVGVGDDDDSPVVRLQWVSEQKGVKKESVLVVHWDERDDHPRFQKKEDRKARQTEHKQQWMQVASESTDQVILLLLTPSPARSLLNLPDPGLLTKSSRRFTC